MIKKVHLTEITLNERNPRTIREVKFNALVKSLITFPKMLDLREIVVDENNVIIGGNMRYRALSIIYDMDPDKIREIIDSSRKWQGRSAREKDRLVSYWEKWQNAPVIEVKDGSELDEYERKEFIAKDNESYGETDWDIMGADFDEADLDDWGLDLWPDEDEEKDNAGGSDEDEGKKLTFVLSEEYYDLVVSSLKIYDDVPEEALLKALGIK